MELTRGKRLKWNIVSSLIFQVTTVICGFVIPRLILKNFGSQVNGLVNSITQFLHIITFLELGVGAVIQSALYEPLTNRDNDQISKIIRSANKFFSRIAYMLLIYIFILLIFYPLIINKNFDHLYTAALILAISISSFAQYYFGIVDRLLLTADQKGYIQYTAQTVTLLLNTVSCVVLVNFGASIHLVKFVTSIIYLARPILLRIYINHHYNLNRKISYTDEPIKQKWNGIAQHVASVVLDQTDIIVLSVFSTLTNVSIYSVYHLVIYGIKNLFLSLTNGVQSLMGELLAKKEEKNLKDLFDWTEWLIHTGTTFVFGCTAILILPFVTVYTKGITDADYNVPMFAVLITLANAGHCLRLPYNTLILAAGHYKQTQNNYILAAVINIFISVLAVKTFGLIGVAVGTLCAMVYQTVWMAIYDSKYILKIPIGSFIKHMITDIIIALIASALTYKFKMDNVTYASWAVLAVKVAFIWIFVILGINAVFYRDKIITLKNKLFGIVINK